MTAIRDRPRLTTEEVLCAVCGSDRRILAPVRPPRDGLGRHLRLPGGRSRWVICGDCGLVYQSPRPLPEALDELYLGGGYHADRGGVPDHYIRYSLRRSLAALDWADAGDLGVAGLRALDVGCGVGGALVALQGRGYEVSGVEPDPDLSAVARDRFGLDVVTGYLDDSKRTDGPFDLIYSCHVWEHLAQPVATTRVVADLLRPETGRVLIVVPTFRSARTWAWSCFSTAHTYMFTHESLGNVLRAAGLEVERWRYAAGADSELWLIGRRTADADVAARGERATSIAREIRRVPLRAPLGIPGRTAAHLRLLGDNPLDFARRSVRWAGARARRFICSFRRG